MRHWLGQEPADAVSCSGFDQAAADEGFIVVAPSWREGPEGVGGQDYTTESVSATDEMLRFFDLVRADGIRGCA